MPGFDPRVTPARPDLAAEQLRGAVEAQHYAAGKEKEVVAAAAPLRRAPAGDAPLETEALRGERATVYELRDGWAWVQLADDGYVGYLPAAALGPIGREPTHRVVALRTLVFPTPSIKAPPVDALPFGGVVAVVRIEGEFAALAAGGFVPARHVAPLATRETDPVAVAERFLGAPYLWGGKTSLGLDCSGLVQLALTACGIRCPRDSDMQERELGTTAPLADARRGDLIFWSGHVGIVRDADTLLHANAFHMAVAIEPLAEAVGRIAAAGQAVTAMKRLL